MTAPRELAALFWALGGIPLGPVLMLTYVGVPWQLAVLACAWAMSWYLWLWARVQREEADD